MDEVLCVWEEAARLYTGWDWLVTEHCVQDGVCGFEVEGSVGGFVRGWLPSQVANTELSLTLTQTLNHVAMAAQLILNCRQRARARHMAKSMREIAKAMP